MDATKEISRRKVVVAGAMASMIGVAVSGRALANQRDVPPAPFARPTTPVPVAFLLGEGATMIDFAGPWEVFQDAGVARVPGFTLYTVATSLEPIVASGGMRIIPDFTLESSPPPKVIVVPAQIGGREPIKGDPRISWLRKSTETADIVMSVCTGAFMLAQTGILSGKKATTHHRFLDDFKAAYPDVDVLKNQRFVDNGNVMTTGGLSSGIEGALHILERYYGSDARITVANYMEYVSHVWTES